MPFELRPEPQPTLRPEGDYLQRAWQQSVYPIARRMGVPINLPPVSPQPHTHSAFEGYQFARGHGKGNDYNRRVLEAFFVEEDDPHVNPLGAKGLAELSLVGVAAAVANAVYHATGKRVRDLPITPEKLL